ncbi:MULTISPECIES: ABC transporter permease [Halorussus]|uniref:ABC transporter permease n=1 Tax=Halorussus TaxID=1070314 RepID=UPI0020A078F2|nr:ABC transporter permease [Halorussus vallis]USZ77389.1 ABC transporter permease [Halorussus vallis]
MIANMYEYRELIKNLVRKDFKLKYRWSILGFAWSLINPISLVLVYTLAFNVILSVPIENFTLYLVSGLFPWMFFASTMQGSTTSILGNSGLVKNMSFPRGIMPLADLLFNFVEFLLTLTVFFPIAFLFFGADLSMAILAFPAVLLLQFIFLYGICLTLSAGTVLFRDLEHIVEIIIRPLFWMTPIVYEMSLVPGNFRFIYMLNPFAPFVISYQSIFYRAEFPQLNYVESMLFWTTLSLIVGSLVFKRYSPYFAEEI